MNDAIPETESRTAARPATGTWVAHKFGGSSVADARRMRHVAGLLSARPGEQQIVVVSAMKGVTDALIAMARAAAGHDPGWRHDWDRLRTRHLDAAYALTGEQGVTAVAWLEREFGD